MEPVTSTVDLITILECIPTMLDCYVGEGMCELRNLRQVSKEARRVTTLAVRSFSLACLRQCLPINGVGKFLQQTRLQRLDVDIMFGDGCNPASQLGVFLQEAGTTLRSVTTLHLAMRVPFGSAGPTPMEVQALSLLVGVCPATRFFGLRGWLPVELVRKVAVVCPLIEELSLYELYNKNLEQTVQLLPSIFPRISTLCLPPHEEARWRSAGLSLPDMSANTSIRTLHLGVNNCDDSTSWGHLPPNLQHLICGKLQVGPPSVADASFLLPSLVRMIITNGTISSHALAQLLRTSPILQHLDVRGRWPFFHQPSICVECVFNKHTVADFATLQPRVQHILKEPSFKIDCGVGRVKRSMGAFFASLPCMIGVTRCTFSKLHADVPFGLLLHVFPDMQHLDLNTVGKFDDMQLQELTTCAHLTSLCLQSCKGFTPMGVLALCLRMPTLSSIQIFDCVQLQGRALKRCVQLLERHGVCVNVVQANKYGQKVSSDPESQSEHEVGTEVESQTESESDSE